MIALVGAGGRKSGQASSIFSLSLDSEGKRLATAGLDCTIRIWSSDKSVPNHLLAVMSRHTGAVLCVRWSPNSCKNSYLASSSDDAVVLIWQKTENRFADAAFEAATTGASVEQGTPSESYTVVHRLVGHVSDVNGVEWSSDGRYLASCGIEGKVLVWDVNCNFCLAHTLETDPKKPLKGLVWDPLGQYLAAQSNDGCLYIWRMIDWKLEAYISSLYSEPVESYTYFSRPAWSPDGQVICLPDSINQNDTVALLIQRDRWSCEESLVGHASSVQIAKFSPRIYKKDGASFLLIALGSQDGVVSLWSSISSKPLAVINGLFEHAVMDLAWTGKGLTVYAASYDGTIAEFNIKEEFVGGKAIQITEQTEMLSKLEKQQSRALNLPTSVNQILLQNEFEDIIHETIQNKNSIEVDNNIPSQKNVPSSQLESKLKNGKRRITPQLLQSAVPNNIGDSQAARPIESYTVIMGKSARKNWLKIPSIKTNFIVPVTSIDGPDHLYEIVSSSKDSFSKINRIAGKDKKVVWEDKLEGAVISACASSQGTLIVASTMQKLFIFSESGRRLFPPLLLSGNACHVLCADDLVIALLENGLFYIWKLPTFTCLVNDELPPHGLGFELIHLEFRTLSNDNVLQFYFSDNTKLVYSQNAKLFFQVEDPQSVDPIIETIWGRNETFDPALISQILAVEDKELRSKSLAHMEAQIAACQIIGDTVRIVPWLIAYCQRIAIDDDYHRASELISSFNEYVNNSDSLRKTISACFVKSSSPLIRSLADNLMQLN